MPLYEFECGACQELFEELVRTPAAVKDVVCPNCNSRKVKKKLSTFATQTGARTTLATPAACASGST